MLTKDPKSVKRAVRLGMKQDGPRQVEFTLSDPIKTSNM